MSEAIKYSPMLEQYFGMKSRYPEAILLSRVGDFYEAYGDDAQTIAQALQIALTSKESGGGRRVAMAGVPHHALSGYLHKLVAQRFIVALAEQLEAPVPNKLVRRDVVRIVTPGTLIEEQLLDGKSNNYLAAISAVDDVFAVAYADISTGELAVTAIAGESAFDDVLAELLRIAPAEIVADVPAGVRAALGGALDATGARIASPAIGLVDGPSPFSFEGISSGEAGAVHRALGVLAAFVKRTSVSASVSALRAPSFYRRQTFLALDHATRKHLELTKAQGQNPRATLLATLDRCATAMGSRMLARWILAPLVDRDAIAARHDAVQTLIDEHARRDAVRELLAGCFDLERIAQKVAFRRALPRDLASLRRTLEVMRPLAQIAPPSLAPLVESIVDFGEMYDDLAGTLADEPPAQLTDGGVIRPECDDELAQTVALRTDARSSLSALEERERERTGIKSLKIKYASAFGYAIEIGKAHAAQRSGRLRSQANADDGRAVHHAGTQRARTRDLDRANAPAAARRAALRRTGRTRRAALRRSARRGGRPRSHRRF